MGLKKYERLSRKTPGNKVKQVFDEKNWLNEFNEFIHTPSQTPPEALSHAILQEAQRALNPPPTAVFGKLLVIHTFFGTLSLSICNQFDLNPFNTTLSLSDYFMTFGHSVCMFLCGVLFVSFSLLAAGILLTRDEFLVIRRNFLIQIFLLCSLSLATFVAFGAQISVNIALLWCLGAFLGASLPTWTLPLRQKSTTS